MLVVSSFVFKVFYNGHFSLLDRDVSSNSLDSLQNPYHFLVARTSPPASPLPTTPPATSASMGRPAGPLAQDRWANSSRQSCGSVSCFAVMGQWAPWSTASETVHSYAPTSRRASLTMVLAMKNGGNGQPQDCPGLGCVSPCCLRGIQRGYPRWPLYAWCYEITGS